MKTSFAIQANSRSEDLKILVAEDDSQIDTRILSVMNGRAFMEVGSG